MNLEGIMPLNTSTENRFQYNGKELEKDGGIDLSDYGARWYDASLGRFVSVDRFAEKYSNQSPYHYAANNPIKFIDVNGDSIRVRNNKYKGQTLLDLSKIYSTPEGKLIIDRLLKSKNVYTIDGGAWWQGYNGLFREVNYKQKKVNADGVTTPSFISLAHELYHAFNHEMDGTTERYGRRTRRYKEYRAMKFGNYMREVYSKGFRQYYSGLGKVIEKRDRMPTNGYRLEESNVKIGRIELSNGYFNQTIRHFESLYRRNGKWTVNASEK